jgi:hypothetical protein
LQFIQAQPRPDFLRVETPWEDLQNFFRTFREEMLRLIRPPD